MMELSGSTSFYTSLKHYKPICYSGKGSPVFLINTGCGSPLICMGLVNLLFMGLLSVFVLNSPPSKYLTEEENQQQRNRIIWIDCFGLLFADIAFLLTQFLNPGINDPASIPFEQFNEEGRQYCTACNKSVTREMKHCQECSICVHSLDHHCGFFAKCIAGKQKYAYFTFMLAMFMIFILSLVTACFSLEG